MELEMGPNESEISNADVRVDQITDRIELKITEMNKLLEKFYNLELAERLIDIKTKLRIKYYCEPFGDSLSLQTFNDSLSVESNLKDLRQFQDLIENNLSEETCIKLKSSADIQHFMDSLTSEYELFITQCINEITIMDDIRTISQINNALEVISEKHEIIISELMKRKGLIESFEQVCSDLNEIQDTDQSELVTDVDDNTHIISPSVSHLETIAEEGEELNNETDDFYEKLLLGGPVDDEIDYTDNIYDDKNDSQYEKSDFLREQLGNPLLIILSEICLRRPTDPVNYMIHKLLKYHYNHIQIPDFSENKELMHAKLQVEDELEDISSSSIMYHHSFRPNSSFDDIEILLNDLINIVTAYEEPLEI